MSITIGCDIGQSVDPTAIIVTETYQPVRQHLEDHPERRHLVRWVERVPLGTLYTEVVERIAVVAEQAQLIGFPTIVLDATGVGRPVVDMLRKRTSVPMRAVTFTAGGKEKQSDAYSFKVPKGDLVTALEVVLQGRRLDVTPDCPLQQDLNAELGSFDFAATGTGHTTYDGAAGSHDDLVMALCLALWWAERGTTGEAFITAWRQMAAQP